MVPVAFIPTQRKTQIHSFPLIASIIKQVKKSEFEIDPEAEHIELK